MTNTLAQGREEVARLVEYYATNQEDLRSPGVKEAHVRQVLIDPFFVAFGWDVLPGLRFLYQRA